MTEHEASLQELIAANDDRMEPLLRAHGAAREEEISRLIVDVAARVVDDILARYGRRSPLLRQDTRDISANVNLRLVLKLRALPLTVDGAIQDFVRYVARLTYNAINDHLRAAFPARMRLKHRLRYCLLTDPRLASWPEGDAVSAGLTGFRGKASAEPAIAPANATAAMLDDSRPADALVAIFTHLGAPALLDDLVDAVAGLWDVSDTRFALSVASEHQAVPVADIEDREYLYALWAEIKLLRPMQRQALLLNLRSADSVNVIALLVHTGVAKFAEIAAALEQTPSELAAIWNDLPLDDHTIAARLGVTRQQVINLRKSARERLTRRMPR